MRLIDSLLNRITMYRLLVYGLGILGIVSVWLSVGGRLSFSPAHMAVGCAVLITSAYITNRAFAGIWRVPTNSESWLITALILFFIVSPPSSVRSLVALAVAGALSSASKFLLAWRGKHIFNPAAFAAAFLSISNLDPTSWWVGSSALWPYTLLLGLLVVRKTRRFTMVLAFAAVSAILQYFLFVLHHQPIGIGMKHALAASPLIFLATIMLTEPATMPSRRGQQAVMAALVAALYITGWKLGPLVIYPEVALLIGNIYAYLVSPKFSLRLQLKEVQRISDQVYNYVFIPDRQFSFLPGQYMEWTLPHVPFDHRGNRRTFTIASSPTENTVQVGLKYYEPTSTYKYAFSRLEPGDIIYGSQIAGDFTLKGNEQRKLAFIAGGIGITPFRSMLKYLSDTEAKCDAVLLYSVTDSSELAYKDVLTRASENGVKVVTVSSKLNQELIAKAIPDYDERLFFISGPNAMVDAAKHLLHELNVSNLNIKTDHFSGY